MKPLFTKESDQFPTDKWLMRVFAEWFDPCPLDSEPKVDGLSIPWKDRTYVNPPYSNPFPWVEKAIWENKKGKRIVLLLKLDPSTKAYLALKAAGAHFLYVGERLKHGHSYSAPFPSVLAVIVTGKQLLSHVIFNL